MGIYADVHGEIKIEPELTVEEITYFRSRLRNLILTCDWKNSIADTEEEAIKWANEQAQRYIKMKHINIDPYRAYCPAYLEFIAKMFGKRASGKIGICSSTTYGDPNVNGGWTNSETTIEFKDGKVTINHPSSKKEIETENVKKETSEINKLPVTLHIGGNLVQTGKTEEDLTLLQYSKELRSLAFYHTFKLNGEELTDGDEILNLADNNKCYSIPYFDGNTNNFLFIKGGMVATLNPVSGEVIHSGSYITTEQDLLNEKYGKGNFKIIDLPYLKGVVEY